MNKIKEIFEVMEIIGLFLIIPIYVGYVELINYLVESVGIGTFVGVENQQLLKIILYPLLGIYVVLRFRHRLRKYRQEREEFMAVSKVADATVLNATQVYRGSTAPQGLFHIKVHGTTEFEAYIEFRLNVVDIPQKGGTIKVRYNPQNHDQVELADGTPTRSGKSSRNHADMLKKLGRF